MSLTGTPQPTTAPSGGIRGAISAASKPLGGLISVGIGICGFAVPALHSLGTPFSTALIVAGLGAYGLSVGTVSSSSKA